MITVTCKAWLLCSLDISAKDVFLSRLLQHQWQQPWVYSAPQVSEITHGGLRNLRFEKQGIICASCIWSYCRLLFLSSFLVIQAKFGLFLVHLKKKKLCKYKGCLKKQKSNVFIKQAAVSSAHFFWLKAEAAVISFLLLPHWPICCRLQLSSHTPLSASTWPMGCFWFTSLQISCACFRWEQLIRASWDVS